MNDYVFSYYKNEESACDIVEKLIDNGAITGKEARVLFDAIRVAQILPNGHNQYPVEEPSTPSMWVNNTYSCKLNENSNNIDG